MKQHVDDRVHCVTELAPVIALQGLVAGLVQVQVAALVLDVHSVYCLSLACQHSVHDTFPAS